MNQHFVPRVYLKHFAKKRGSAYYVDVYDKVTQKVFNTNITNICAERDLYTLSEDSTFSDDKLVIEKIYAHGFEPMYDRILSILTDDTIFDITDLERLEILLGIFQLYMRNPRIMRISIEHHEYAIKDLFRLALEQGEKGINYLEEDFSFREWTEEDIIEHFSNKVTQVFKEGHIGGIEELGTFHEFSKLEVSKNRSDALYFTSDNPLVTEDMIDPDDVHPMQKSKEFVITLNPQYSLRIYHDNRHDLNVIVRPIVPNGNTASRNHTIFDQASRFIIGSKKAFDAFFEFRGILGNTSFESKIDMMRQMLSKFLVGNNQDPMYQSMQHYLDIFDKNGQLTFEEEQAFYTQFQAHKIAWKKSRTS